MPFDFLDLITQPEGYVCIWRDGELYIEPVADAEGESQRVAA